jgi:hypothetical protein
MPELPWLQRQSHQIPQSRHIGRQVASEGDTFRDGGDGETDDLPGLDSREGVAQALRGKAGMSAGILF